MAYRGEISKNLDYDRDILEKIDGFGKWQKILFALLWLPSGFSAMAVFMYSFIAYTPEHRCRIPECDLDDGYSDGGGGFNFLNFTHPSGTEDEASCYHYKYTYLNESGMGNCVPDQFDFSQNRSIYCDNGWTADDSIIHSSASIDLGMVCSDQWKKSFAQSLYMAGMLVGSFVFGTMADFIGRRATLVVTSLLLASSGSICALLPSSSQMYSAFATLRFLMGMGHVGTFMQSFTLSVEYVGPADKRTLCGCLIEVAFAAGGLIVGLLAWAGVRNWRTLMLVCSAPAGLIALLWFAIPESPRWLIAKGRIDQLRRDVKKTARINKRDYPADVLDVDTHSPTMEKSQKPTEQEPEKAAVAAKATLLDLFRPKKILWRTICMFYNWMVTTLCYYGLTMAASDLSDDVFVNFILVILIEIPANFFCVYAMDKFGRKPLLVFSQILAGVSCIAAGLMTEYYAGWLPTVLSIIGKFGATCSFTIIFIYTSEMYPTEIRSTAVGSSSTCARIGGILAPQVANLNTVWVPLPLLIMGGSSLIGGLVALLNLPETLGKKLPENMEDALNL